MSSSAPVPTLRERTRRAVRQTIEESGRDLFERQGYEATTVEQIARAAGMSERSFFRYFASKEDLVMGALLELAAEVVSTFRSRPAEEDLWSALGQAFAIFARIYDRSTSSTARPIHELIEASPALAAAFQLGRAKLQAELVTVARDRTTDAGIASVTDPRLDAVIGSGLACVEAAERAWVQSAPDTDFVTLLELTMRYARPGG